MDQANLEFEPTALEEIAAMAIEKGTGARSLRGILENIMLDIMFDLPEQEPGQKFIITKDVVLGKKSLFEPDDKEAA